MISDKVAAIVKERAAFGQLELDELTALAEGILEYPWKAGDIIVEIGTYKGRTPVMMAKAAATAGHFPLIVSIDAFERVTPTRLNCRGNYGIAIASILEAGLGSQCVMISASSNDVASLIPNRAGVLIIDGWHSYEQTKADLENYVPKLIPGGLCLVDDYCDFYPEVIKAVDEFVASCVIAGLERKLNKGVILRRK